MKITEKMIENQILMWLSRKGIFVWKVKSMGTYDTKLGRYRAPSPLYRKGVSDIIGIYKGKPLAIEVKSAKGRLSPEQGFFLHDFNREGGIGFVARSIEEVEQKLKGVA